MFKTCQQECHGNTGEEARSSTFMLNSCWDMNYFSSWQQLVLCRVGVGTALESSGLQQHQQRKGAHDRSGNWGSEMKKKKPTWTELIFTADMLYTSDTQRCISKPTKNCEVWGCCFYSYHLNYYKPLFSPSFLCGHWKLSRAGHIPL